MPSYTITLTDKAVERLEILVHRTNIDNGTTYTLQQWLQRHTNELAIAEEMSVARQVLQALHEQHAKENFEEASRNERDRLLADLETDTVTPAPDIE